MNIEKTYEKILVAMAMISINQISLSLEEACASAEMAPNGQEQQTSASTQILSGSNTRTEEICDMIENFNRAQEICDKPYRNYRSEDIGEEKGNLTFLEDVAAFLSKLHTGE